MRIRAYFPFNPFPPQDGSSWVVAGQVRALLDLGHDVELVTWFGAAPAFTHAGLRSVHLGLGQPASRAARAAQSLLNRRSMPELAHYPNGLGAVLNSKPLGHADVGIYNYSFAAGLLARGPKREDKTIAYFHNWESSLSSLRARAAAHLGRAVHARNARLLARAEEGLFSDPGVDEIWFISPSDFEEGRARGAPRGRSRMVGPALPAGLAASRRLEGDSTEPPRFGMIGRLDYEPNFRSARWIVEELAPRLAADGFQGAIEIIGRHVPDALVARSRAYPFVRFEGFVADVEPYWRRWSGFLMPDHGGSGVRVKLLEAVASQVPVLANGAALERALPEIASLPFVLRREGTESWAREMAGSHWAELRAKAAQAPFPDVLDGSKLFRSLGF